MSGFLLGSIARVEVEDSDLTKAALIAVALEYIRAGGLITPGDWAQLDVTERSALSDAGELLAQDRADYLASEIAANLRGSDEKVPEDVLAKLGESVSSQIGGGS